MAPAPPLYVNAPAVLPYGFGLLSVAQTPINSDGHWQNGIQYEPAQCGQSAGWPGPCSTTIPDADKGVEEGVPLVEALPFVVYDGYRCKLPGRPSEAEILDRARQALLLGEQRTMEEIFWTGSQGNTPYLASPDAVVLNPNPVPVTFADALSPVAGIAALESYLGANYGGTGVIHVPRGVVATLDDHRLISQRGTQLVTTLGTLVAAGAGYVVNTGPDGVVAPPGTAWLYATGQVLLLRSDVFLNPPDIASALNRTTNELTVLAERIYLVSFECVHAAVLIQIAC